MPGRLLGRFDREQSQVRVYGRRRPIRQVLPLLVVISLALGACSALPRTGTKGTMPPPGPNGAVDPSAMPDFIAVAGDVGRVGWVEKAAVTDVSDRTWPVYGDDLRTVVGHLVPGKGFVPTGVDPNAASTKEVKVGPASPGPGGGGNVTVYVRNCSPTMAWIAVVSGGQVQAVGSGGYWPNGIVGAGDFDVGSGDRLVVVDHDPREPGAAPRRSIYLGGSSTEPVSRWVNIDKAGGADVGSGIPDWWGGVNPPC